MFVLVEAGTLSVLYTLVDKRNFIIDIFIFKVVKTILLYVSAFTLVRLHWFRVTGSLAQIRPPVRIMGGFFSLLPWAGMYGFKNPPIYGWIPSIGYPGVRGVNEPILSE